MSRSILLMTLFALCVGSKPAAAQPLVADLSNHVIAITTDFTGATAVLFGAVENEGEIAVVVTGPPQTVTVREKRRVLGLWMNRDSQTFTGVPSFYALASTVPVAELGELPVLERHNIGAENVRLAPADISQDREAEPEIAARLEEFGSALVRRKEAEQLWRTEPGDIYFLGNTMFRASFDFPANVPTGTYTVSVMQIRDGELVAAQTTPLIVSKSGTSARIFAFATQQPMLYGIIAILVAIGAGWAAGAVFRRG